MSEDKKVEGEAGAPGTEADKEILSATDRFKKSDINRSKATATQPVLKAQKAEDPLSLKSSDTGKLQKIKPKSSSQTLDIKSSVSTDTVQLKVIKEKKKQLAGILTASQTIRLRPPSESAATAPAQPQTLKLSATDATQSLGKLKAQLPSASTDTGTIKVSGVTDGKASGTLKLKGAGAGGSGTLKLKGASSSTAGGTLKLKSSGSTTASGGTLKLTSSSATAPATTEESAAEHSKKEKSKSKSVASVDSEPGVLMTISSVAAVVALGVCAIYSVMQYMKYYS